METILVIEDNSDIIDLQKTILEMEGYEVFTAQSGSEALKVLTEIEEPDLILLDLQIGDMTGIDFLNLLEEKKPKIIKEVPIVFVTGMYEVPKSKAAGLIKKPTELNNFLELVHQYIEMGHHLPYQN